MGMIESATSTDYPGGKACIVIKLLLAKYRPVDRLARVEMRQALNSIKMKSTKKNCNEYTLSNAIMQ